MANSAFGSFTSGEKTVTTAGTAVALGTDTRKLTAITLIAKAANTGQIYVGGSDVDSSTNDGLDAGDTLSLSTDGISLAEIYIDSSVNGEGVDFYAAY